MFGGCALMLVSYTTIFTTLLFAVLSSGCFCKDVPREQKLTDCTTNVLAFRVTWPTGELFSIVLGVPYSDTNALAFRGELIFRQSTGTVARVRVGSDEITSCNWLDNQTTDPRVAGFILTWRRTNATDRLDNLFTKGQSYDVEVIFTRPPPSTSTFWLHWIGQIGH
jgi:hypothetical protein